MNTDKAKMQAKQAVDQAEHSASADKARGHVNQVVGSVKEKVGNLIGDDELAIKGKLQQVDGKKDEYKGKIKEGIEDVKSKVQAGIEVAKEKLQEARSGH